MQLVDSNSSHTDWSMIARAAETDAEVSADALEQLVRRYWSAVYAYIRRSGRDVHEAADLTQGFVCDVLLSRRLCDQADPRRGRFRALLLAAVRNYLWQQGRRRRRAGLRDAARPPTLPPGGPQVPEADASMTPEEAFCYHWSATLVRHVLADVRQRCLADGLDAHWAVFESRVVRPMLFDEPPTEYDALVERFRLKDQSQAANMMITVKRRFARALRAEVGRTVSHPDEVEDELCELLGDLERAGWRR